jgi:hypothetical protein
VHGVRGGTEAEDVAGGRRARQRHDRAIRESVWAYPLANVGHIVALTLFVGSVSVAVVHLRLPGAFAATPPAKIVRPARAVATLGLAMTAPTGVMLFAAEASHVAMNPVFQIKAGLIALAILNALVIAGPVVSALGRAGPDAAVRVRAKVAAALSLALWIAVAACGRLIAYF